MSARSCWRWWECLTLRLDHSCWLQGYFHIPIDRDFAHQFWGIFPVGMFFQCSFLHVYRYFSSLVFIIRIGFKGPWKTENVMLKRQTFFLNIAPLGRRSSWNTICKKKVHFCCCFATWQTPSINLEKRRSKFEVKCLLFYCMSGS